MKTSPTQTKHHPNRSKQSRMRKIHIFGLFTVLALALASLQSIQQTRVRASADQATSGRVQPGRAVMGQRISVQAAGRGNPWINLKDGREVLTAYSGPAELTRALEQNQVRPLSLSSADYDEDGVPDLVSGYSGPNGGIITILRGNVDSIYPNAPAAKQRRAAGTFTESPFLSPALVVAVPEAVDFVGSGDFDGNSHWDVVTASRDSNNLYVLSGDGKGGLGPSKQIQLSGTVTSLITGEINRADGLDDIIVGINGREGPKALVFEGPEGASRAKPEIFDLPAEAKSFALGQLYGGYTKDLAIAAGNELLVVQGRDRKVSLGVREQTKVSKAVFSRRSFQSDIVSIASGDFSGDHTTDIALLSDDGAVQLLSKGDIESEKQQAKTQINQWQIKTVAQGSATRSKQLIRGRMSSTPADSLIAFDTTTNQLQILSKDAKPSLDVQSQTAAVLPMRLNEDALSDLVILRSEQAAPSIVPTAPVNRLIVTNTNDKGVGSLRAAIVQANASQGAATISFDIPGGVPTIKPQNKLPIINDAVTIDGTTQAAGRVELDGTEAGANNHGLDISGGNSVVRGLVINGFGTKEEIGEILIVVFEGDAGIRLRSNGGNLIEGNFIGTDVTGSQPPDPSDVQMVGILIFGSSDNIIGGTVPEARNVLSGNLGANLTMTSLRLNPGFNGHEFANLETTRNKVQGNYIGTDVTGTRLSGTFSLFVSFNGIGIRGGAFGNLIGGTTPGAGNRISSGFPLCENVAIVDAIGNLVQGNLIGTVTEGALPEGTVESQSKLPELSVNNTNGPNLLTLARSRTGVIIADPDEPTANNTVGGTTTAAGNFILNQSVGVEIVNTQSTGNLVQGNTVSGNGVGVRIADSPDTTIGGASGGAGNLISANGDGVTIGFGQIVSPDGSTQTFVGQVGATVQGNYIETNSASGVFVETESLINTIKDNRIAFNGGNGVSIPNFTTNGANPGVRIAITSNLVFSNTLLGIDLGGDNLVTANDSLDTDAGANFLQNFPLLTSSGASTISGTLNSTPNSTFDIEFFFANGCSGGSHQLKDSTPVLLGSMTVTTNGSGNTTFSFPFAIPTGFSSGFVNATATDQNGNTSEFSECIAVGS